MSLNIGKKVYRNIQEQVAYNTECIEKLAEAIDGIDIEDKLVIISNESGIFSSKELEILSLPLAFISNGSRVWIKDSESLTEFVYKAIDIKANEIENAYFNIGGSKIVVTRATGAYVLSDDVIITTYSKSQLDSIVTNIMALMNGKASLSGANFSGGITAPSIIENMEGYSFHQNSPVYSLDYVGVCKNGNKITFVVAGKVNVATPDNIYVIGNFFIPEAIGAKIYPIQSSLVSFIPINAHIDYLTKVPISGVMNKNSNTNLDIRVYTQGLTANTNYMFRIEQTFLLSDNLAA